MATNQSFPLPLYIRAVLYGLVVFLLFGLYGCTPTGPNDGGEQDMIPAGETQLDLDDTSMEDADAINFDTVHSALDGEPNAFLIFGAVPANNPAANLSPELAAFLGRWEGFSYAPPVRKDWKYVLVVQEINAEQGKALLYGGTNLQYPAWIKEIHFRVAGGASPAIEWAYTDNGKNSVFRFSFDADENQLVGWQEFTNGDSSWGPIEMNRSESFVVYKDYEAYLSSKRIYAMPYHNQVLSNFYGKGYLLYLPEGYEENPEKDWPLIFFLHGSGDRGDNIYLLAKASPFMMIREKGPLPFIIAAPLLNDSGLYKLFPTKYTKSALDEVLADYRVDEHRIYVTGLSLGGEATYSLALKEPERFAAIAPLSAFIYHKSDMVTIKHLPVWAIHGEEDIVIPLSMGKVPVDLLEAAGGDVRFSVLEGHDHDVWTDTYMDPQFYDWLLEHSLP